MGTQLSFGGSGSAPWDEAAEDAAAIDATGPAGADGQQPGTPTEPPVPGGDEALASLMDHIVRALDAHERKPIPGATASHTPSSVRPSRYAPGGPSVRSSTSKFVSTPRSGRSTTQSVARGAAAVSAGAALARGDRVALDQLGLDLDSLAALSPREQQQRILDELLGAPGHPDDEALRRATHETLKAIATDPQMTQDDQIDYLLASYVYEQALVELTSSRRQTFSRDALRTFDSRIRPYIYKKAKHVATTSGRYLSPALFIERATQMTAVVLGAIRSHAEGAA